MAEGGEVRVRPVVLVIMDGWGTADPGPGNAVALAETPTIDRLEATAPKTHLTPFGEAVGLPGGQMGNSEVGHMNLGAGRVVPQTLMRIGNAIADGSFAQTEALVAAMRHAKEHDAALHLLGLIGPGGVHAQDAHLLALLRMANENELANVCVHAFLDGRDTPPQSAREYVATLEREMREIGTGRVTSVSGRYYAMDRDTRWDRVQKAYDALTLGAGETAGSADEAISRAYDAGITDEFVVPTVITGDGKPIAIVKDDDAVIFFNFRTDRSRELSRAFVRDDFDGFEREARPHVFFVTMTEYEEGLPVAGVAFPPETVAQPLAEVVAAAGLAQLHCAETEKYPHVTFFFNGGREGPFEGEERTLVDSPRDVKTYDEKPEMSASGVTDAVVGAIESGKYAFVLVNFANPDMVGHTGVLDAAIKACETVDECVGKVLAAVEKAGGAALVTADHGNADEMLTPDGKPMTAHSMNPVPLYLTGPGVPPGATLRPDGLLADVAPTVLALLGVPQPEIMTGKSLIVGGE